MESLAIILSAMACGSVVFITGLSLYFKIRNKFPIRVNCWFCNNNTDVPYRNRNCWDCPHCDQYNGFLPDGSYNKTIPAQHDELLNHPVHAISPRKQSLSDANGNGLCRKCNINQELKVQQLAVFMPINPARYDEEVDEFRHHLERAYRLCSPCEEVLEQTLHKQKSMLPDFRLKKLRNTSLYSKGFMSVLKKKLFQFSWNPVTRYFTAVLAAWFVLAASVHLNKGQFPFPSTIQNSSVWCTLEKVSPQFVSLLLVTLTYEIPFTAFGMVAQFAASSGKKRGKMGIICMCLWILLHVLSWLRTWKKLEKYISLLDFSIAHVAVAFMTLCVCTLDAMMIRRRYTAVKRHNITRKYISPSSSTESSYNLSSISDESPTSVSGNCQQKHLTSTLSSHEDDAKLPEARDFCPINATSYSLHAPLSCHITSASEDDKSEDLGRGLGNLTLGSSSCENWISKKNGVISSFETKVYGQNRCSELFNGNLRNRKRPIIRPSQLSLFKNVTQSSWVAGGYWQSLAHRRGLPVSGPVSQEISAATAFAPLSRSSSQSSGFVSQSSQRGVYDGATSLPNSHTGSICGADIDSFSALSEPISSRTTTPVCYAAARPGTFIGASCYGGPPIITHQAYSVVPQLPVFLPNYGSLPHPQPIPCYYPPQSPRPLSPIWNQSAFSVVPVKQPLTPAADVLSQCSSQDLNENRGSLAKTVVKRECVWRQRTFVSAVRENLFLAILFAGSLLFNVLILVGVMLWNSSTLLSGMLS